MNTLAWTEPTDLVDHRSQIARLFSRSFFKRQFLIYAIGGSIGIGLAMAMPIVRNWLDHKKAEGLFETLVLYGGMELLLIAYLAFQQAIKVRAFDKQAAAIQTITLKDDHLEIQRYKKRQKVRYIYLRGFYFKSINIKDQVHETVVFAPAIRHRKLRTPWLSAGLVSLHYTDKIRSFLAGKLPEINDEKL